MKTFTIGKLASAAGVGVETIRYYERRGLIHQPQRHGSGYRQYPRELVQRIQFIKQNQTIGFSLREIRSVLVLLDRQELDCEHAGHLIDRNLVEIEQKIEELQKMRKLLLKLRKSVGVCGGIGPMQIIMEHLDHEVTL